MTRLSVLLTTEGSYPFYAGEVSAWCRELVAGLDDASFTILAVTSDPHLPARDALPPNVASVIAVPIAGMDDPAEYGHHASFAAYLGRRRATTAATIEEEYLPHLERFLHQAVRPLERPRGLALALLEMHLFLRYYDYDRTQRHDATWSTFARTAQQAWHDAQPAAPAPTAAELFTAWRFLYRVLLPIAVDVPKFDVTHATVPGFCGLPGVVAKLRWGTPYVLSEHGAYLREHHLAAGAAISSPFVRWFAGRLTGAVVALNYALADQVSPVCERTAQWERWHGVDADRLRVIPRGIVPSPPAAHAPGAGGRPTVVCTGSFTPSNGQLLLIEAAAIVRRLVPSVEFRLYGASEDLAYRDRCVELVSALGLDQTVVIGGDTHDADVLRRADVAAVPASPDGVSHALIAAMMAEVPIVAVDEGGAAEALDIAGIIVPPADPVALAEGITALLQMPDSGRRLAEHARERALDGFTLDRVVAAYRASYQRLARPSGRTVTPAARVTAVGHAAIA